MLQEKGMFVSPQAASCLLGYGSHENLSVDEQLELILLQHVIMKKPGASNEVSGMFKTKLIDVSFICPA